MASDAFVDELILRIDCAEGREAQAAVLAELDEGGEELARRLAEALPSLRGSDAAHVCWALSVIGPRAREALPALEEMAARRSMLVLKSKEASAAERAIVAVRADDPQFVLNALASARTDTRMGAVDAIATGSVQLSDEQAADAVEVLAGMLDAEDWGDLRSIVSALKELGFHAQAAVPVLAEHATSRGFSGDPFGIGRLVYIQSLGALGDAGATVGPVLGRLLTDREQQVRQTAMRILRRVGPQDADAIPPLLAALEFESPPVGMVGPGFDDWSEEQKRSTRDAMEEARSAHQAEVRAVAAWALGELGEADERVLHALARAARSTAARLRWHAVTALGRIGAADDEVSEVLERVLATDSAAHVRRAAARALGLIGPHNNAQVAALAAALGDIRTRKSAAWALRRMGETALDAAPALIDACDANERRRSVVARALAAIGPQVMHDLRQGLHRDGRWQRIGCAEATAAFGAGGREMEATLRELLFDRREDVREAGQEALEAISGDDVAQSSEGESDE